MKICIDMRPALSRPTGVGSYVSNLVASLAMHDRDNSYFLFSSSWKERYPAIDYGENFHLHDIRFPVRLLNFCWHRLFLPPVETLLRTSVDVIHSPTPLRIPGRQAKQITTVHDLHFYFHPEHAIREVQSDYPRFFERNCRKSDAVITVSEYTRKLLIEILKIPSARVHCIPSGVDPFYLDTAPDEEVEAVRTKYAFGSPYYLFVGTREPRKNLVTLMKAFRTIPGDSFLVVAGPKGWGSDEWKRYMTDRVTIADYLSKKELRALYRGAIATVVPSLEEGFGFPLLEAMASGTPVIASRIPVFEEVAGEAYLSFSPTDVEELAERMMEITEKSELRSKLIDRGALQVAGYSWDKTAARTLGLYRSLVS